MMKGLLIVAVVVVAMVRCASAETADDLLALVKDRNQVIERIVKSPTEGETEEERAQIKMIVSELFDFNTFSEVSLGRYWKERTDAEKTEFAALLLFSVLA